MENSFDTSDVVHNVAVKFSQAFLPEAKKAFNLRTVRQKELNIKDIARKAATYNIGVSPQLIEQGLNTGMGLIGMLVADGYKIKTPLFTIKIKVPGEYDGTETCLPDGVFPVAYLQTSAWFQKYIREMVRVDFDGKLESEGFIACALDEATGLTDEAATRGQLLTIRGTGLKIVAEEAKKGEAGVYFAPEAGAPVKAEILAINHPRTLKVLVPQSLVSGESYKLVVITQSSVRANSHCLKEIRTMRSEFTVTAQ